MRQPCKTRPFSFATLVCPYCQDRFVLLRLCWFLSVWPVSYLLLKLLTETSFRHCFDYLVSKLCSFVLLSSCLQEFQWPSRSRSPSRLTPRRSRKRVQNYTFSPNWQNLSQYFFRLFSHPPPQLPTNQPVTPQKNFNKKAGSEEPAWKY